VAPIPLEAPSRRFRSGSPFRLTFARTPTSAEPSASDWGAWAEPRRPRWRDGFCSARTAASHPKDGKELDQVVLAGMSANLCVEAHLRELLERGFEVAVVRDASAAARIPDGDGYQAGLTNFRFMANAVWST